MMRTLMKPSISELADLRKRQKSRAPRVTRLMNL